MRFDEINILGEFKINGLTGSPGQALGLSGSEFTWITVSASSVIDAVGLTGTDYVICQSVNTGNPGTDAIENGNRLKSAYATASALYVSNRVSVLITPGDYDLGATPLLLTTTNIDLIGLSSDASDVILRGSGDYVLQLDANIDTSLYNVTLGTSSLFSVYNDGNTGDYLRWNNVIAIGNMFSDDNTSYESLNGEFKNIKVYNSPFAFYTLGGDINGTYDNIEIIDVGYGFFSNGGFLLGTYSNITLSGTLGTFFQTGADPINASFENIKSGNINNIFSSYQINGTFRNIEISDADSVFSSLGGMDGIFEDIKIGNVTSNVLSVNTGNLTGTFSNIEVGDSVNLFYCNTSGNISGSFKDIKIGDVTSNAFQSSGTMSGSFKNITLEDCTTSNIFQNNDIDGVFDSIEVGNFTTAFYATNNLTGTYSNLKFGDGSTLFFVNNSNLNGYFENISCGAVTDFFITNLNINGTFKNITTGLLGSSFKADNETLDGYYEDITLGNVTDSFTSGMTMSGTFSNIQIGDATTNTFYSIGSLIGKYENIKIGTCSNAFVSTTSDINGYFDTIEIGGVSVQAFVSGNDLNGIFKNITMNNSSPVLFNSTNSTNGTFENILFNDSNDVFGSTNGNLYGTFSNITSYGVILSGFVPGSGNISGYFKDITLGTVSSNLMGAASFTLPVTIDNFKVKSYIQAVFPGKIINSFIDARGLSQPAIIITDDTIVERSKFLSDTDIPSINSGGPINAQISFTITNYGITSSITNDIGTPLNIDNSNIT